MNLNIKVYQFIREFDDSDVLLSFTETISCSSKEIVMETIRKCLPGFSERDINVYDIKVSKPIFFAEFDYFYGPVEFHKSLLSMTIEQYLSHSGEEDTIHIIFDKLDGRGGGIDAQDIIDILLKYYEFTNIVGAIYGGAKFSSYLVKKGKKALKKYQEKHVQYGNFQNFIYSKEIWTLEELKETIECNDEEAIDFIMQLCLFGYDKEKKIYKNIGFNHSLGSIMTELSIPEQIDIYRGYFELLRMKANMLGANARMYIIDRLVSKMNNSITNQGLNDIFTEIDQIVAKVFPDEYSDLVNVN